MSWLKSVFGKKEEEQVIKIELPPIEINVSNKGQFRRNVARLYNLHLAYQQGDVRASIQAEIEERKKACEGYGHKAPQTLEETKELLEKL